jgi:hypothetical protein
LMAIIVPFLKHLYHSPTPPRVFRWANLKTMDPCLNSVSSKQ